MLKIKFAVVICVVLLLLTGCAAKDDFADYEFSEPPAVEGLTAETEFSEYDGDTEEIRVIVTNDCDTIFSFSEFFSLQKKVDGEWKPIKFGGKLNLIGSDMPARSTAPITFVLKDHVKLPLLPGQYRIWVGDSDRVSAEFTIK